MGNHHIAISVTGASESIHEVATNTVKELKRRGHTVVSASVTHGVETRIDLDADSPAASAEYYAINSRETLPTKTV